MALKIEDFSTSFRFLCTAHFNHIYDFTANEEKGEFIHKLGYIEKSKEYMGNVYLTEKGLEVVFYEFAQRHDVILNLSQFKKIENHATTTH